MITYAIEFENNDTTPMDAVVRMLQFVFGHDHASAFETMLKVHKKGRAVVGTMRDHDLSELLVRLDEANAELENPIAYRVLDCQPDEPFLAVCMSDLPTKAEWESSEQKRKVQARFVIALLLFATMAFGMFRFGGL